MTSASEILSCTRSCSDGVHLLQVGEDLLLLSGVGLGHLLVQLVNLQRLLRLLPLLVNIHPAKNICCSSENIWTDHYLSRIVLRAVLR